MSRRLQVAQGEVGELPVIVAWSREGAVKRRTVAEVMDAKFLDAVEIGPPLPVVAAGLHLVDPGRPLLIVGMLFSIPVANMKLAMTSSLGQVVAGL